MQNTEQLIQQLNAPKREQRLEALRELKKQVDAGAIPTPDTGIDVNNHIHTIYSFSPYSPSKAVWMAYTSGLCTAGIMDHDSISGAREFIEAGKIIGMPTTIGMECRVDFSKTAIGGRRINNPDQNSCVYMGIHGIPHTQIDKVSAFFAPYRAARGARNKAMVERINAKVSAAGIKLDYEKDVLPLSQAHEDGGVTERHLLFALANALIARFGKGAELISFLESHMNLKATGKALEYLTDADNPMYAYDLLGLLKSDVTFFYINATEECPDVKKVLALCEEIGAISAYAYLGDVGSSVTGDKRAQKFEDDYIDQLFEVLSGLGYRAVTYMPSRNTTEQLARVRSLCRAYGFFQISGEDINSPRQLFICKALQNPEYHNLIEATWALIGHEKAGTEDLAKGMFSKEEIAANPDIEERIKKFAKIGRS